MRYKITDLAFFLCPSTRTLQPLITTYTGDFLPEYVVLWEMGLADLSRSTILFVTTMAELYSKGSQHISHTSKKLK